MEAQIISTLENRGVRPTAMRILVLQIFLKKPYAISLSDLEASFDHADRITLFRTLKTFEKHHVIHKIIDGTGVVKYGLCDQSCNCMPDDSHIHFHCTSCKKTFCFKHSSIPNLIVPKDFSSEEINIVINGICNNCNAQK